MNTHPSQNHNHRTALDTGKIPLLSLLTAAALTAAAAQPGDLEACRFIADAAARLACYDQLDTTSTSSAPQATGDADKSDSPQSNGATTGIEIVRIHTTATGRHRYELANGEVWEQLELRSSQLREGDKVNIRQGLFGGWHMREHSSEGRSLRVRRLD